MGYFYQFDHCCAGTGIFRIFRHCLVFIPRRHIKSGSSPYGLVSFSHQHLQFRTDLPVHYHSHLPPLFRPIQDLVHALEQVSAGNFDVRLKENDIWYEVREMNLNFNKMVKELNSIETLQSDFIQNVSHEIKTPLAAIEGYAALLSASTRDEQNKLYAEQILKSSRQLSTLTGNILKLSKLENQSIISEKKTFSLDEQIRQAVLSLEPIWSAKNIDIDLDLPEISFYGNEDLIFQIWTNLISNGIKFTPSGGLVSVKMTAEDSFVNVVVADNGIGMTEEVQKHIFDKFYQAEGSRSMEGNGLGLTLVKRSSVSVAAPLR